MTKYKIFFAVPVVLLFAAAGPSLFAAGIAAWWGFVCLCAAATEYNRG